MFTGLILFIFISLFLATYISLKWGIFFCKNMFQSGKNVSLYWYIFTTKITNSLIKSKNKTINNGIKFVLLTCK